MNIEEKIILQSINRIQKRVAKIDEFLTANPLSRVIEIRREAGEILVKHKNDYAKIAKLLEPLSKEERKMFALSKRQCAPNVTSKMIDEKVALENELSNLQMRQYYIERRKTA